MIYNSPYYNNKYNFYKKYNYSKNIFNENLISENKEKNKIELKTKKYDKNNNDGIINILGINLAFDDLLILGLLYFLYQENVKDIGLYIVLILLLLN